MTHYQQENNDEKHHTKHTRQNRDASLLSMIVGRQTISYMSVDVFVFYAYSEHPLQTKLMAGESWCPSLVTKKLRSSCLGLVLMTLGLVRLSKVL